MLRVERPTIVSSEKGLTYPKRSRRSGDLGYTEIAGEGRCGFEKDRPAAASAVKSLNCI